MQTLSSAPGPRRVIILRMQNLRVLLAGTVLALTGCHAFFPATPTPIPTQESRLSSTERTATLVVFLPGRSNTMADFEREGFLAILREAGVKADTLAVNAHFGYYAKRTVIERLRADVIRPAREHGYRRIVLVGVSLGGVGALLYEREHPGEVEAIVVLAPYLGDKAALFEQIKVAGGPTTWATGRNPKSGDVAEQLWTFLGTRSAALPPTWLLFGSDDSLAPGHRLFATLLPPERVRKLPGAHNWKTWRALWQELCRNSSLFALEKTGEPEADRRLESPR